MKKLGTISSVLIALLASAFILSACGSSDDSGSSGGGKEGGTIQGAYTSFPDYMDPQLSYTAEGWTTMYNSYIPLLTYNHAEGAEGSKVIPGLAEDMPEITNGGKTYKLKLRKGLKYSDGTPIKASDFANAVKRMFILNSGGSGFYTDIVGAEQFEKTKKGEISGIKTDDKTGDITIDLVQPRGTFTNELALMFVAPVPPTTPNTDQSPNPPAASGPYMFTESDPGRGWTLERNPEWAKTNGKAMPDLPGGHIDKFVIKVIRNQSSQVNDVLSGKLNWIFDPPPSDRYAEVKAKYEGSQFRPESTVSTYYFWMNTQRAPFDDVKVRQAVNYAVDPAALERIYAGQLAGTQQILPPGMPGYEKFELYPHDLEKAKEMIKEANPADRDITVWTDAESPNNDAGTYYQDVLNQIGFNAKLKILNPDNYFTIIGNAKTADLDTGWSDWFEDYPHPNDFFDPLLNGDNIATTNNNVFANSDFPDLNKKVDDLAKEQLGDDQISQYSDLDKAYMEQAPWAPYGTRTLSTFVSDDINLDDIIWNPTFEDDFTSIQFK